jgi:REP element-mobilizing transposase RayT
MSRPRRILYNGAVYHVMARGNRGQKIFLNNTDRLLFLEIVAAVSQRYHLKWRSFTLMTTHYHGCVETPFANLPEGMRQINGEYSRAWNRSHGKRGHMFGEPFVSKPIEDEWYAQTALKYIAWNPVEAKYVSNPLDWTWSSARATAGLEKGPAFLDLEWLPKFFGERNLADAQHAFLQMIQTPPSPRETSAYLRRIVWGSEDFEEEVRRQLGQTMYRIMIPRNYKALGRPSLGELFEFVGDDLERRNQMIRRAQIVYGYRQSEIARTLNLHPNTISRIVRALRRQRFYLVRVPN